jgi:hypothetical protein
MDQTSVQYIVDGDGKKTAVVLPIHDFDRLIDHLEDLEDALTLDQSAVETQEFVEYQRIRAELLEEGRL